MKALTNKEKWIIAGMLGITAITLIVIYRKSIKSKLSQGYQIISEGYEMISDFVNKLKDTAISEWNYWKNGQIKEGDPSTMERLREYWREGAGVKNWSDRQMTDEAWSAAFVSYVMKKSGAGSDWKYSPSHSTYIVDSIKNRKLNNDKPFKGYKPNEVKLEVGDLIGYARQSGVTYDTTGAYKSHTDIVVNVKDGVAETIGGNIGNSVTMTKVPLTPDGKVDSVKAPKYFVVIKNEKK